MSDRDFAAEMRAVIDSETSSSPYVSRLVANHIVEKLSATDPDLLNGWLIAHAEQLIWAAINQRDRSVRGHARRSAGAHDFSEALGEDDIPAALGRFLGTVYPVDETGTRKRLAELAKADLIFVAEGYERRAEWNAMNAAFMRALAKAVGRDTVADRFTDEKLAELWQSLGGK